MIRYASPKYRMSRYQGTRRAGEQNASFEAQELRVAGTANLFGRQVLRFGSFSRGQSVYRTTHIC
jgi:hypothetical protein